MNYEQSDLDKIMNENQDLAKANRKGNPINAIRDMAPETVKRLRDELSEKRGQLKSESEADFQSWVIDLAKHRGYKVAHFRGGWSKDGKRFNTPIIGDPGFPDIVLAKIGRVIFIELKSDIGRLSPEQVEWGRILSLTDAEAYVWRPSDREKIVRILT